MADFTPSTHYEAWAAVKVENEDVPVPEGMELLILPAGTYAVFDYQGLAADFGPFAGRIFGEWLPAAGLKIDNGRPHFEYLSPAYRPDNPDAEEQFWVPIMA